MEKRTYWQILLDLWKKKQWISNEDFRAATKGSPKLTSRISDMRKRGVEIVGVKSGSHNVYALITPPEEVEKLMKRRKAA